MQKIKDLVINAKLPKKEVYYLLKHVLNLNEIQLMINEELELSEIEYKTFIKLCDLRRKKVPLNYLSQECEFYSRTFKVTQDTLIPRQETEHIIDAILEVSKSNPDLINILDLGTGSGIIAITLKLENKNFNITAIDKLENTLNIAKYNADKLDAQINFFVSDWFKNIKNKFDIIVSNPPYISINDSHLKDLTYEPLEALTDYGNGFFNIKHIIEKSNQYLNKNGWLFIEHGYNQGELVRNLFKENSYYHVSTIRDFAGIERISYGKINL